MPIKMPIKLKESLSSATIATKKYVYTHKIISILAIVAVIFAGYQIVSHFRNTSTETRYVIGVVKKGTLTSAVTGTGHVSTSDQIDIEPEVSGTITWVPAILGEEVKAGTGVVWIDDSDAKRALDNAQLSVSSAELSYERADPRKTYEDGYDTITNTFIDIPDIITAVKDIYYNQSHSPYFSDIEIGTSADNTAITYKYKTGVTFDKAVRDYNSIFPEYKNLSVNSNKETILNLLKKTLAIARDFSSALNGTYITIDYIGNRLSGTPTAQVSTDKTTLNSYITKIDSDVSSLSNALLAIEDAEINLKSKELSLGQTKATLEDAKKTFADHVVRAPFDGTIASVSAHRGDRASVGTALATLITHQKIAEISLNEIDAAGVAIGQETSLTFDALNNLEVKGKVSEISMLGTVDQGVVSYIVKIAFDTDDKRVKVGMTTNAMIITAEKQDIIVVPTSAVKSQGDRRYVEIFDRETPVTFGNAGITSAGDIAPQKTPVKVGITNDTGTEIISGLTVGDKIVTKVITATAKTGVPTAPSIFGATSGAGGTRASSGGNVIRNVSNVSR